MNRATKKTKNEVGEEPEHLSIEGYMSPQEFGIDDQNHKNWLHYVTKWKDLSTS